jgi:hypothetical protein
LRAIDSRRHGFELVLAGPDDEDSTDAVISKERRMNVGRAVPF